jgi:hypothetical protein
MTTSAGGRWPASSEKSCCYWGIGTYSSLFTAAPLSLLFHQRWAMPKATPVKKRTVRSPEDSGAVVQVEPITNRGVQ